MELLRSTLRTHSGSISRRSTHPARWPRTSSRKYSRSTASSTTNPTSCWTGFGIREPQTYYTILRAIATGKRAANEIAGFAGVDSNALGSHLSKLCRLRLVERDIPVTADPNSTPKSRYRLKEPLFRFCFRYVYGQQGELVQLGDDAYEEMVEPTVTDYMGTMFEQVCQNQLPSLIPKTYHGIGYWWHKQHELDVVGLASDGTLVAGECKCTSRGMTEGDLADVFRFGSSIATVRVEVHDVDDQHVATAHWTYKTDGQGEPPPWKIPDP